MMVMRCKEGVCSVGIDMLGSQVEVSCRVLGIEDYLIEIMQLEGVF